MGLSLNFAGDFQDFVAPREILRDGSMKDCTDE